MTNTDPDRQKLINLRKLLINSFNLEELRVLCFDLGLDYEELAGKTKTTKMQDFITYLQRRGELQQLLNEVNHQRPNADWPDFALTTEDTTVGENKEGQPVPGDQVGGDKAASEISYMSGAGIREKAQGLSAGDVDDSIVDHGGYYIEGPHTDLIYTDEKTDLEMIKIPAGEFIFGEENRLEYLSDFWISKAPVTNAQYWRFVRATGYGPPGHWEGKSPKAALANHPVTNVSWHDAKAYALWAGMHLPTEEEWEKAARGTDGRLFPWGNAWKDGFCNTREAGIGSTTPVSQFSPQGDSPYGCVDMAGNVWDWTASWYDQREKTRVVRGGSWFFGLNLARAAFRYNDAPINRNGNVGFRVVVRRPPSR